MRIMNILTIIILFICFLMNCSVNLHSQTGQLNGSGGGIIAFTSNRDGQKEIYFMNADGSSQTRITNTIVDEHSPKWSNDGSKLAFRKEGGIYFVDILDLPNGVVSEPHLVIEIGVASLDWTPNGCIIFDSPDTGNWNIYIVKINGDSLKNITNNHGDEFDPDVSPDGTEIVFVKGFNLWKMNMDGTNRQQKTYTQHDFAPVWSPDGNQIAYISGNDWNNLEICIADTDGTNKTWLTNSPWLDEFPSWSPDGMKLTYENDTNNKEKVFTVTKSGTATQLTNTNFNDGGPDWYPVSLPDAVDDDSNQGILPQGFRLFQNYPNPFNPTTSIKYSIANESFVLLKIFDVLGNEILTLVNEKQSAGNFKVEFDGSDLTNGVYFYQLKSGDFINVKKMILLK